MLKLYLYEVPLHNTIIPAPLPVPLPVPLLVPLPAHLPVPLSPPVPLNLILKLSLIYIVFELEFIFNENEFLCLKFLRNFQKYSIHSPFSILRHTGCLSNLKLVPTRQVTIESPEAIYIDPAVLRH